MYFDSDFAEGGRGGVFDGAGEGAGGWVVGEYEPGSGSNLVEGVAAGVLRARLFSFSAAGFTGFAGFAALVAMLAAGFADCAVGGVFTGFTGFAGFVVVLTAGFADCAGFAGFTGF